MRSDRSHSRVGGAGLTEEDEEERRRREDTELKCAGRNGDSLRSISLRSRKVTQERGARSTYESSGKNLKEPLREIRELLTEAQEECPAVLGSEVGNSAHLSIPICTVARSQQLGPSQSQQPQSWIYRGK